MELARQLCYKPKASWQHSNKGLATGRRAFGRRDDKMQAHGCDMDDILILLCHLII